MDILLIVLGFVFCLGGILGSIIPILPGPPVGWVGLLLIQLTDGVTTSYWFLGITFVIAITLYILDYIIPALGTKHFGGSRAGAIGATIGLIIGILSPIPFGILIGPFVGALIGELAFNQTEGKKALKAAFGSFLGFLTSTFMKLVVSFIFLGFFLWDLITNWNNFF